ncbi:unnamed protein product [Urochloa humidicola]
MVENVANIANEGTAAAATAQLASQETAAVKAHQSATAAIASFRQNPDGPQVDADPQDNPPACPPRVKNTLNLSNRIQGGVGAALGACSSHTVEGVNAAAVQINARAARSSCIELIVACDVCISAFEAVSMAISNKLADAQGDAEALPAEEAQILQEVRILALQTAIRDCSPRLRCMASRVRSSLQVINATVGIPAPVREGLRAAHEHMLVLKIAANSPFFCRRLGRRFRSWCCKG